MAHTLLLIRHAKAVRDEVPDEVRQLAPRGIRDARAVGSWIAEHGVVPDRVVVSPARRTVQTWEKAAAGLDTKPLVITDERIYDARLESLLEVLSGVDEDVATLAMVGHNPSMHALAMALDDGRGAAGPLADIANAFPTSAVAVLDVSKSWAKLAKGTASLREFAVPRG